MWPPECRLFTELYENVCAYARVVASSAAYPLFFTSLTLTCNEDVYYLLCLCACLVHLDASVRFCKKSQFKVLSLCLLACVYVLVSCLHALFFFLENAPLKISLMFLQNSSAAPVAYFFPNLSKSERVIIELVPNPRVTWFLF